LPFLPALVVGLIGLVVFAVSPLSNVLNVITVPLGYEWQSCPHCPAVGIDPITWSECAHCGEEHRENFGAAAYRDGARIPFCSSECLDIWKERDQS